MNKRTSSMVEAGILSAVAIALALAGMYIPVIGGFLNFVWPLPIAICGMRHGLKWSIMTLFVAGVGVAMIISPLQAFLLVAIFGILGVALGEAMHRRMEPGKLMAVVSVAALISIIINFAISFWVLDINPINMMFESFDQGGAEVMNYYREMGLNEEDIARAQKELADMVYMMKIIMPGAFLFCAPVLAFINYWCARKIMQRAGETFAPIPDFYDLSFPKWILVPFFVSLFMVTYYFQYPEKAMYAVSVNIQMIFSMLLVIQGIIMLYWYVRKYNRPKWLAHVAVAFLMFVPLFAQIILYVGAFDLIFDFRKLRAK